MSLNCLKLEMHATVSWKVPRGYSSNVNKPAHLHIDKKYAGPEVCAEKVKLRQKDPYPVRLAILSRLCQDNENAVIPSTRYFLPGPE